MGGLSLCMLIAMVVTYFEGRESMRIASIFVTVFLPLSVYAQSYDNDVFSKPNTVMGLGASNCAEFSKVFRTRNAFAIAPWYTWSAGLASGINLSSVVAGGTVLNLNPPSFGPDKQLLVLQDYCKKNPYVQFESAAINLLGEIKKHQPEE